MDDDARSYRRFLEGDEKAFDEIMGSLFRPLVFFVDRFVHDVHTAEDIAIDAFSELIVHRHRYNFKVTLKTYLFMLGRSRALDCLRHRRVIDFEEYSEGTAAPEDEKSLEETVITNERGRIINEALKKLPSEMSQALHLIYFENMSYEEAAKVMKKSRKQIDNLLYRAKNSLKNILGEEGKELI